MEFEEFTCHGVVEAQRGGMKEIPVKTGETIYKLLIAALAIHIIAGNRVPDGTQMHPYLMRPARLDLDLEE